MTFQDVKNVELKPVEFFETPARPLSFPQKRGGGLLENDEREGTNTKPSQNHAFEHLMDGQRQTTMIRKDHDEIYY